MLKTKVPISSQTISVLRSTCSSKETTRGCTLSRVKCATSLPTASGSDEKHKQNSDRICREITKLTFSFATYTSTNKQATQFTAILPGKCQKSDNITSPFTECKTPSVQIPQHENTTSGSLAYVKCSAHYHNNNTIYPTFCTHTSFNKGFQAINEFRARGLKNTLQNASVSM